ncbi:molybdenum ABC transporter ATP-binding protein [Sansalvadorimonas sp. 2012CJ34-2]|uniref:Molybdenum ABC transporter ATP-binding protein n=1 Tax=Parendozoicomonas callyspongiae TaxID=2942213 RepID=A0ABT0PJ17_9GAMM|nr:molybdenum ABC transporter ATP-binding protein [Sansalvadorimonas sp. 2012CJ34-2]MCL6271375.1 molybdenum ABC transporter ATP-binding protein [Sansalvadorimonas sp. 2012CJ34-2]
MLDIDLKLERSEFQIDVQAVFDLHGVTGVMGPSGCGKTTLLRCIAGLEKHAKGHVIFHGETWLKEGEFVPPERRGVGYIFQDGRLFPHLSVLDNLRYGLKRSRGRKGAALDDVVSWLDMDSLLDRHIGKLSGGQRQRVAIARALLGAPRLLLMDEPMAALDWAARSSIMPRLRDISRHFQVPVLFVSHDREEMARLTDELVLMDQGRIVDRGSCRQMLSRTRGSLADDHAISMLEARVVRRDQAYNVTELDVDGRLLVVDQDNLVAGETVRVVIPAAEVSLSLDKLERISIQNRLETMLDEVSDIDSHHALVSLKLETQNLLVLITRRARHRLGLKPGMKVYAHFKAACLEVI